MKFHHHHHHIAALLSWSGVAISVMSTLLKLFVMVIGICVAFQPLKSSSGSSRGLSMVSDGRTPLMGGNWKLNPVTLTEAVNLASEVVKLTKGVSGVDVALFPPAPFVAPVAEKLRGTNVKLGGQNCYHEASGAFTGEVATGMLKDLGASYVLIGHSERRTIFGETDAMINLKVKKALKDGLKVVLCIGETKEQYEAGLNQEVCAIQIMNGLKDVTAEDMARVVLAYEPVWAIGTGLVCPKEVAQQVHAFIRSRISAKYGPAVAKKTIIQYGGSVKADNIAELMAQPDIDGALVGGASLVADSFAKIVNYKK